MSALSEDTTVPTLDGWKTTTEVASILGITRQHAYRLIADKTFPSIHRFGTPPQYVVQESEVLAYKAARDHSPEEVSA